MNQLDLRNKIKFPYHNESSEISNQPELEDKCIVPLGGGKDSLLVWKMLQEENPLAITLGHNPYLQDLDVPIVEIKRQIDPKLIELNRKGAYNGHVPFSAILGSVVALAALLYRRKYIVLANERSANEANTEFLGTQVNHQYSKSFHFEQSFNQLLKDTVHPQLEYFSILRQFSEVRIAKDLSKEKDFCQSLLAAILKASNGAANVQNAVLSFLPSLLSYLKMS